MKKILSVIFLLFFVFVLTDSSFSAGEPETPTTLKGGKIISAEEARKLHDQKVATFVDTRNPMNFGKGHIPGAVLIPYSGKSDNKPDFDESKDQFDMSKLHDKNAKIVFYGHGTTGWKAYKAAVKAAKAGYKNVLWLRGGLEEWEKKGFPRE